MKSVEEIDVARRKDYMDCIFTRRRASLESFMFYHYKVCKLSRLGRSDSYLNYYKNFYPITEISNLVQPR